jgi:hypothetical protein
LLRSKPRPDDDALRLQAREIASRTGRDAEDLYKTLRNLERSPSERLALGLNRGKLGRALRK